MPQIGICTKQLKEHIVYLRLAMLWTIRCRGAPKWASMFDLEFLVICVDESCPVGQHFVNSGGNYACEYQWELKRKTGISVVNIGQ